MRNAFVVLVSLYIGLASGFIVPSGGLELIGEDHAILADNNGKESEESKKATLQDETDTGFIVLPFRTINNNKVDLETNHNRIKDKELYDQPSAKHNNVNERSFIYINQKFKTPVVNQLYSSQDLLKDTYKSVLANLENTRDKFPYYLKAKKEYFEPSIRTKQRDNKRLFFPPIHYSQEKTKSKIGGENTKEFKINLEGAKVNEQHEYIELLKPPLLRPVLKDDNAEENSLKWSFPSSLNNRQPLNNINAPKTIPPADVPKYSGIYYDNYGFPTPYGYQRSIPKYNFDVDELSLATDINIRKLLNENNNPDVSKLIDRYLKDSLEEQVTNERMNARNNCSYSDCILKPRKQYLHSRVSSDPECKCSRKLNVKRIRNESSSGMSTRETTDKPETVLSTEGYVTPRSSEIENDYSDMLTDEMNLKKLVED